MSTEYTKTTWQTGDIITADKMNNIENGIKGIEGDITTLSGMGSEIDELGEELTDIKDGLNVYKVPFVPGNIATNGTEGANSNFIKSDFIEVDQNTVIYLNDVYVGASANCVSFYNKNKTYIADSGISETSGNLTISTIPQTAKYVRLCTMISSDHSANFYAHVSNSAYHAEVKYMENVLDAFSVKFVEGNIATNGTEGTNSNFIKSDFVPVDQNTVIYLNDVYVGASANAYSFYKEDKTYIANSGANNVSGNIKISTIPTSAKYVRLCTQVLNNKSLNYSAHVANQSLLNDLDIFSPQYVVGHFITTGGNVSAENNAYAITDLIPCNSQTIINLYGVYVGGSSLAYAFYKDDLTFISGQNNVDGDVLNVTIPQNAAFVRLGSAVNLGGVTYTPSAKIKNLAVINGTIMSLKANQQTADSRITAIESELGTTPVDILVFGDSISDTINITIDSTTNKTTAYTEKNPNNSYVNAQGQSVSYWMWPHLIGSLINIREMRNYALSGAHFKYDSSATYPRQNALYQLDVAINDLPNLNNVFPHNDFFPDIVIVALGTNDNVVPDDAYETSMAKTVMAMGGIDIDVDATLANLDKTKSLEAMRFMLMKIRQQFPTALPIYINPPQNDWNTDDQRRNARKQFHNMAQRYGFIELDGYADIGIVRDFEKRDAPGMLTKDGLHPNEKGQNMYAVRVASMIKEHFIPYTGLNP